MSITTRPFGQTAQGETVTQYILTNKTGATVKLINYGANLTSLTVPDREGKLADVVTGFDTLAGYLKPHGSMGDTIGRYGNRIAKGRFTLDGVTYQLAINNGENHLHGGLVGFSAKLWEGTAMEGVGEDSVRFHLVSPDGDENYPGTLTVDVTYTWSDACDLSIHYEATKDKATHCNLTNHTYFNLAGHDHGTIRDHVLFIDSDCVTATDAGLIPTGAYLPVVGTPFDLRDGIVLGDGLDQAADFAPMAGPGGYDHNFVLRKGRAMGAFATLYDPTSGRSMECLTDLPGVQLYTANTTDIAGGKGGAHYGPHCALCLETQCFPDTPNHPNFPTTVLRPGEKYDTTTIYAFRVEPEDEDVEE